MGPVQGGPPYWRSLKGKIAGSYEEILHRLAAMERAMGEESVIADGQSESMDHVRKEESEEELLHVLGSPGDKRQNRVKRLIDKSVSMTIPVKHWHRHCHLNMNRKRE